MTAPNLLLLMGNALESLCPRRVVPGVQTSHAKLPSRASRSMRCAASSVREYRLLCWMHERSVPTGEVKYRRVGRSVSFQIELRARLVL